MQYAYIVLRTRIHKPPNDKKYEKQRRRAATDAAKRLELSVLICINLLMIK